MTGKSISTTPPDGVIEAISASHILHPHHHFTSPNEVLAADISAQEKRAILACGLRISMRLSPLRLYGSRLAYRRRCVMPTSSPRSKPLKAKDHLGKGLRRALP
ncbi:hypothetical protein [Rhizobium laguerreae]|uniref:hypothetical protein n=1 Tax=Rhizobium laguerreae TaxID=1076926 RepID=UPI0021B0CD1B|nr:hypothetical protein [Rhizobium laguerreae]